MKNRPEVLIIGGGVIGVCSAYFLTEHGHEVTLLERKDICSGCSYGNAGLTEYSHAIPIAEPGVLSQGLRWLWSADSPFFIKPRLDTTLFRWLRLFHAACNETRMRKSIPVILALGRASKELFEVLHSSEELEFGYRCEGRLSLFNSEAGLEKGIAAAKLLGEFGVQTHILDGNAVRKLEPNALSGIVGGIQFPEYGHLIPDRFVHAMASAAARRGADIRISTEVMGFDTSSGRISAVITTRGDFRPRQVVLAAGALSPFLANNLGLQLPIQPAKGYGATFKYPRDWPRLPLALEEKRLSVTPMRDGFRVNSSLELAGYDASLKRTKLEAIRQGMHAYLGGVEDLELQEFWGGFRPLTPDGLPIIGRSPDHDNLIIATGHGTAGMTQGPITGKLVSQLAVGAAPQMDLSPLRVERFG